MDWKSRSTKKSIGALDEEVIESSQEPNPQPEPNVMDEIHKMSAGDEVIITSPAEPVKMLDVEELRKPSKGEELIQKIKQGDLVGKKDDFVGEIRDGVEIVDVRPVEKKSVKLDRHGLPVDERRRNWDSI